MNRKSLADTLADLHAQYDQARDSLEQARDSASTLEAECASITTTLAQMETDRRSLLRDVTSLELDLTEMKGGFRAQEEKRKQAVEEQRRLEAERDECEGRLNGAVLPELNVRAVRVIDE